MTFQDCSELRVEGPEQVLQDGSMAWWTHGVEGYCYAQGIGGSEDRLSSSALFGHHGCGKGYIVRSTKGFFLPFLLGPEMSANQPVSFEGDDSPFFHLVQGSLDEVMDLGRDTLGHCLQSTSQFAQDEQGL